MKKAHKLKSIFIWMLVLTLVFPIALPAGITVEAADSKAVKSVNIKIGKENVTKKTYTLAQGKKASLKVTAKPKSAKKSIQYKTSNKKVVTVTKKGKITAKKKGTAKITVTVTGKNGKKKKTWVKVKVTKKGENQNPGGPVTPPANPGAVTRVDVTAARTSLPVGVSTKVTANLTPAAAQTKISWTSSDTSVAVVSADGMVTGISAGSTVITGTAANGVSGWVTITVTAVPATGVRVTPESASVTEGNTISLVAAVIPANATIQTVEWESSDTSVATVSGNGIVTGIKEGSAVITVKTKDGGFVATAAITVTRDSSQDVDGIDMTVSNSISGYPNTVLAGTQAKINVKVTKDGVPVGDDTVHFELEDVAGYNSIYELSKEDIDLNSNGMGTVYVRLKSGVTRNARYTSSSDGAYASFNLKATTGGANLEDTISLSFVQVWTETVFSSYALAVDNQFDPALKSIDPADSLYSTCVTSNKDGLTSQYVIDQKVSSAAVANGDHEVVLDAAPLLMLPTVQGKEDSDNFVVDNINEERSEYNVYAGEEDAYTLRNVPGGLEYLTLTFDRLKLSDYSRIVVRAYEAGTNIPLVDGDDNLIQQIITSDTTITENSAGKAIQINNTVFNDTTSGEKQIDLKIFIESAGQVNEDNNIGFILNKVEGPYKNQEEKPFEVERLTNCVEWSFTGKNDYTAEVELSATEARSYLGSFYNANSTYKYVMPAFPDTGNAIIREYLADGTEGDYYLYPTYAPLNNANELLPGNKGYGFKASVEQARELTKKDYTTRIQNGRAHIDSEKAGYVRVQATINAFDNKDLQYTISSYVQWSNIPADEYYEPEDFFALSGQSVNLVATVKDVNGNIAQNVNVTWAGADGVNAVVDQNKDNTKIGTTDSKGQSYLTLTSATAADLEDIYANVGDADRYRVTLSVAGKTVTTKHAAVHWVSPGIYYQVDVGENARIYETAGEASTLTTTENQYKVGNTWIIGTKVSGKLSAPELHENPVIVADISNIAIEMTSSSSSGINPNLTTLGNGICSQRSTQVGGTVTRAHITGFENSDRKSVITVVETVIDADGEEKEVVIQYESVGEGDINAGADLEIPINWVTNGQNLSILKPSGSVGEKYSIHNRYYTSTNDYVEAYIQVLDDYGNPTEGVEVAYLVTDDSNSNEVVDSSTLLAAPRTDENGLVAVRIPKPAAAAKYTMAANLANQTKTETLKLTFTDDNDVFELAGDPVVNTSRRTITVTFTKNLNYSLATLKDFYEVTVNGNKVDIASVEMASGNTKSLVITTEQDITSSAVLTIRSKFKDTNNVQTYFLLDSTGKLYE